MSRDGVTEQADQFMKVLVLVTADRLPNNDLMYKTLAKYAQVDLVRLSSGQQKKIKSVIKAVDFKCYDRVILDLLFKRIFSQSHYIKQIPNMVFYDMDICQNYIDESKWRGKFSSFFESLGSFRIASTGFWVSNRIRSEGFDSYWLKKGFDESYIFQVDTERDIELGFVGRVRSSTYAQRFRLLNELKEKEPQLQVLRADPGEEYRKVLSRIRYFISSDVGLGEYMAKNFEAMACGCVLFAYRQGNGEEEALGLVDMSNVVLYSSLDELRTKLSLLKNDPALSEKIARSGKKLVYERYTFKELGKQLFNIISDEIPENKKISFLSKIRTRMAKPANLKFVRL